MLAQCGIDDNQDHRSSVRARDREIVRIAIGEASRRSDRFKLFTDLGEQPSFLEDLLRTLDPS